MASLLTTKRSQNSIVPAVLTRQRAQALLAIVDSLSKLSVMMGEPQDESGIRLRLMAESLCGLPLEAVEAAIDAWGRGDSSHLSAYQSDRTRVGIFFPKVAEIREIAQLYVRREREKEEVRTREEEVERESRHRAEHPEDYISMADILRDVHARGRAKLLESGARPLEKPPVCASCAGRVLAAFSPADLRALADLREEQLKGQGSIAGY